MALQSRVAGCHLVTFLVSKAKASGIVGGMKHISPLANTRRVVMKIGSSLIAEGLRLRKSWLESLAADIASLQASGAQVVVVSSGAVALGRGVLDLGDKTLSLGEKQAAAAVGQIRLSEAWRDALAKHDITAAQVLLTAEDSEQRTRYLNARATLDNLLSMRVVPVINENDTVATAELKLGDNDQLAARVAQMISADMLIIFSDVDGLYTSNPATHKDAKLLKEVAAITPDILAMAGSARSNVSTGGMLTKLKAAQIATAAGCATIICKGEEAHPLKRLQTSAAHTRFVATETPLSARKHWIFGKIHPAGAVVVDDGAVKALKAGKSLLAAGVVDVIGQFARGDVVEIRNAKGEVMGKGVIALHAKDTRALMGKNAATLGTKSKALIHCDDLALA